MAQAINTSGMQCEPPNLKRLSEHNLGREPSHIYVEAPPFEFTELFLTAAELEQLCVIPDLEPKAPIVRWRPPQRPVSGPRRNARRPLQAVMAAGLAWLSLPGCTEQLEPTAPEARTEAVRSAVVRRVMVRAQPAAVVRHEPVEAPHQARAAPLAPRPVSQRAELTMMTDAKTAMDVGHYKAALAIYKHLLHGKPTDVEALFGAALASHELRDSKGSDVYLKRALMLAPNHPLANVLAGFTDQVAHRYDGAREHYAKFLSVETQGDRADEIRAVVASLPEATGGTVTGGR